MNKLCTKCGKEKPLSMFYKRADCKSGYKSHCKECEKQYTKTPVARASHKKAVAKYNGTDAGREVKNRCAAKYRRKAGFKDAIARYREKYPDRRPAQIKVMNALASGVLKKPNLCELCGSGLPLEGHHHDYSKPLDVTWVCKPCHTALHW